MEDNRKVERRLTDAELEDCIIEIKNLLPKERDYINSSKKRSIGITALIGAAVGVTSLVQFFLLNPVAKEIEELKNRVHLLDTSVRNHHESNAKEYVLKADYEIDMSRLLSEVSELKGMVMHMGQVRR